MHVHIYDSENISSQVQIVTAIIEQFVPDTVHPSTVFFVLPQNIFPPINFHDIDIMCFNLYSSF